MASVSSSTEVGDSPEEKEQAERVLRGLFDRMDGWDVHAIATVTGSEFADDDAQAPQLSDFVWRQVAGAIDHLEGFRTLIFESRQLPTHACYTLLRGALESAAQAVWVAAPDSRADRIAQFLRLVKGDGEDQAQMSKELRATYDPKPRADFIAQIEQHLPPGTNSTSHAGSTTIVRALGERRNPGEAVNLDLAAWRATSGMAHGRPWALAFVSSLKPTADGGSLSGPRLSFHAQLATVAFGATGFALELLASRSLA